MTQAKHSKLLILDQAQPVTPLPFMLREPIWNLY